MKKVFVVFICVLMAMIETKAKENNYPLIPIPQKVEWINGKFQISNRTSVNSENIKLKNYFTSQFKTLTGLVIIPNPTNNTGNKIIFHIDNSLDKSNKEAYTFSVTSDKIEITGASETGLFRGIQTLFQLISPSAKTDKKNDVVEIPCCNISDKPVFSWRGLNLDCCRHFMDKDFIKRYIDILAYYKFNTFHWHLTEDQGWRIEIKKYPKLTEIGAWRKEADGSTYGGFYTQEDIKEIVAYAESRFINVVPEIEMPGHALASLASYPENSCTGGPFEVTNLWGVFSDIYCAGNDSTFVFLQNVLDEVIDLFPGKYIHIGGDEAPKDRWVECPKCQARIKTEGLKDEHELQSYFIKRISSYINSKGKEVIGWDEILQGGLAPGAIVQSWQSFQGAIEAAKLGHYTICSPTSHTYFDYDQDDFDLRNVYSFRPIPEGLSDEEKKYVLGGEANMWTERAPQETIDSKLFPRILALTEVLWNNPENKNYDEFYSRLQDSYKDLSALGIKYGREGKVMTHSTLYDNSKNEFLIKIELGQKDIEIRYNINGGEPDANSTLYSSPIRIKENSIIKVAAFKDSHPIGKQFILAFDFHKAVNSKIMLKNQYDKRYNAGGENGLIDGVRGTNNFRDKLWQGFEGVDFDGVIDLGAEKEISKVIPKFFFDSNSWIFLPTNVEISLSTDNVNYTGTKTIVNNVPMKNSEILQKEFAVEFDNQKARYVKVKAQNIKVCPDWHPGAGSKAWLMIDEIVVE